MKEFLTIEEKRDRLLKGLKVPIVVHVDSKQEEMRKKRKKELLKNFRKTINGRE